MTDVELQFARSDAYETAKLWNDPVVDTDGNHSFYMDQVSVYAKEQTKRRKGKKAAAGN